MKLEEYRRCVQSLPYGKRLPNAVYIHRNEHPLPDPQIAQIIERLIERFEISEAFNVIKFRTDAPRLSFLSYPRFFEDPHPALQEAVSIDLMKAKARRTDYADNINPPILHRKETLLPPDHPQRAEFELLTQAEEEQGLYTNTQTIGFRLNWERLLEAGDLRYEGHRLVARDGAAPKSKVSRSKPVVHRHKTALSRYELSKPVRTLLENGVLKNGNSVFDYGCGQGTDVAGLVALGYEVSGWDPQYSPETPRVDADVVNLGYVLNVIEDPVERVETLISAYGLARRVLVVSALINETVDTSRATSYHDGVITNRNTFQKYFDQQELQQYIEDALEATALPVAIGIFYVFRDPVAEQEFLQRRSRRVIDWNDLRLRVGRVIFPRERRPRVNHYEAHKELLDAYHAVLLDLGRQPSPLEFERYQELKEVLGSLKRAERILFREIGEEAYTVARAAKRNDLLVYLGLANLRKRVLFSSLSEGLRLDIKTFFGNFTKALELGRELLFAAGDPDEIELACEEAVLGWQDEQALYIHRGLLDRLPPLLRVYVGCAEALYGDVRQADLVKLHKESGKVTFLAYDDFEGKPLPELQFRTKINLRSRWVQVFDHREQGQVCYFKERFLAPEHPEYDDMQTLSRELETLGVREVDGLGPNRALLQAALEKSKKRKLLKRCFPHG